MANDKVPVDKSFTFNICWWRKQAVTAKCSVNSSLFPTGSNTYIVAGWNSKDTVQPPQKWGGFIIWNIRGISGTFNPVYHLRPQTDQQVLFMLEFEEDEIEVAKCVKTNSTEWHILSGTIPELVHRSFTSPKEALNAYVSYTMAHIEDE